MNVVVRLEHSPAIHDTLHVIDIVEYHVAMEVWLTHASLIIKVLASGSAHA